MLSYFDYFHKGYETAFWALLIMSGLSNELRVCSAAQLCQLFEPHGLSHLAPLSMCKNTGVGCHSLLGDLPDPGIEPVSPALVGKFFATEPPAKPSNELSTSQLIFTVNTKVNYITINPTTSNEILCQEELLQGHYKCRSRVSRVEWQHEKSTRLRGFTLGHCQSRALGLF